MSDMGGTCAVEGRLGTDGGGDARPITYAVSRHRDSALDHQPQRPDIEPVADSPPAIRHLRSGRTPRVGVRGILLLPNCHLVTRRFRTEAIGRACVRSSRGFATSPPRICIEPLCSCLFMSVHLYATIRATPVLLRIRMYHATRPPPTARSKTSFLTNPMFSITSQRFARGRRS